MNIIDVIPVSRGIHKDTLSYFTGGDAPTGAIVRVPLRGRTVHALVVGTRSVEASKQELRQSSFAFKKASSIVSSGFLSPAFLSAAKRTADFHIATLGSVLFSLVPKIALENVENLSYTKAPEHLQKELHGAILQADDEERFSHYRSLVREEFARGQSVFLCMPTTGDVKRAEKLLEKGIGEYSYIFHGQTKKKDLIKKWNGLSEEKHPVFIIGTPQFLSVPRHDFGTIIIEREQSRAYKSLTRPFTDARTFAEFFAKEIGARIVFGDTLLRTETVWRYKNDEFGEITPPSMRIPSPAEHVIVDMRKVQETSLKFEPISPALSKLILHTKENSEKLVIFASRRGLAPLTLCADCSTIVACRRCQAPVVLHTKGGDRFFLCHRCGEKRDAHEKCVSCTSWRLKTLGVGVELMHEEIKKHFPDHLVERLDSDVVTTHAQAEAIVKKFHDTPGGILIGTEMMLLYLDQKIENIAVASIDSMFALPDFRIREKIFSILLRLRSLTEKNFLIQTRNSDEPIFTLAEKGNLIDFYKQEFLDRKSFDYPPYTVLIKISLSADKRSVQEAMEVVRKNLTAYDVSIYPAFNPMTKGVYTMHALIKIGRDRWVEPTLFEKLRSLPPAFSIAVDPDSIL